MSDVNSVLYRSKMIDDNSLVTREWMLYYDAIGRAIIGSLLASNNLSDLTDLAEARANLGLGSAATHNVSDFLLPSNNLSDLINAATARGNLGLGSAATHPASDFQGAGASLQIANNLSDVASAATSRSNLAVPGLASNNTFSGSGNTFTGDIGLGGNIGVGGGISSVGAITGALGGWPTWTPTITANGSGITSSSITLAEYFRIGPLVFFNLHFSATFNGTDATRITATLPVTCANSGFPFTSKYITGTGISIASGICSDLDTSHLSIYRDSAQVGVYSVGLTEWLASGFYHA